MAQKGDWTIWRGKHLVRGGVVRSVDRVAQAYRRYAGDAAGDEGDRLMSVLVLAQRCCAEEGLTAGEIGYLADRALGLPVAPERIARLLAERPERVYVMTVGRENYHVLTAAGASECAARGRPGPRSAAGTSDDDLAVAG